MNQPTGTGVVSCHKRLEAQGLFLRFMWHSVTFFSFFNNTESHTSLFKTYWSPCSLCSFFLSICQMVLIFSIHYYWIILRANKGNKQNCTRKLAGKDTRTIRTYCTGCLILLHPSTNHIILCLPLYCISQFQHIICIVSTNKCNWISWPH